MITLITSLLVSFSNDELNRILQSDAMKEMALMNSVSQSQISHSLLRSAAKGDYYNRRSKKRRRSGVVESDEDSEDDYLKDDDSDEVELDRYEEPVQPPVVKTRKEDRNKFMVNTIPKLNRKKSSGRKENLFEEPKHSKRGTARYPRD